MMTDVSSGPSGTEGRERQAHPHLFLSYAHADVEFAVLLREHFALHGLVLWMDTDIPAGDRWDFAIRQKIETCAAVVVLMSPASRDSKWVAEELELARWLKKPILPILLGGEPLFGLLTARYHDATDASMPPAGVIASLLEARRLPDESNETAGQRHRSAASTDLLA